MKKYSVTLIVAVLLFSGIFTSGFVSYILGHRSLAEHITSSTLPLVSNNIFSEIEVRVQKPITISTVMAKDSFVRNWTLNGEKKPEQLIEYLKGIHDHYAAASTFYVPNASRKYYHPDGVLKTVSREDKIDRWFFEFLENGKDIFTVMDFDTRDNDRILIFVNARVEDGKGDFLGAIGLGLSVEGVQGLIDEYAKKFKTRITFVNTKGQIMLSSDKSYFRDSLVNTESVNVISEDLLNQKQSSHFYKRDGSDVYLNARFVDDFGWHLLVEQDAGPGKKVLIRNILVYVLISTIIGVAILFLMHKTIKHYQSRLIALAMTDSLTGLPNRLLGVDRTAHALATARREQHKAAILFIDLDGFKVVNDTLGHDVGDHVLKTVAERLKESIRDVDTAVRLGGDEFMAVLSGIHSNENASKVAEKIIASLSQPMDSCQMDPPIGASIGIAIYPDHGETAEVLLSRADDAMYEVKAAGKNNFAFSS